VDNLDSWPDVKARASVVHLLASRGASLRELAKAANNDTAVLIAAIAYPSGQPCTDDTVPGEVVQHRLKRLVRALSHLPA
jgi:hypothetical protein